MLDFSVTFFITIINIAILCIILRLVLFKPVTKFMNDRAKRVQESIEQSERDKSKANNLLAQYTAHLESVEAEADVIMRNAREHAETEAEKIITESRISAEQILSNAKKQIETEHKAALEAFRQEAANLVVTAASRLLAREIKSDDNSHYASMLLEEITYNDGMTHHGGTGKE